MHILLEVIQGPHVGDVFEFSEHDTFLVGRGAQAHFRLPQKDQFFSRIHFMVEVNPPHCRIMDMGSTNGTYVNDERVTTRDLFHGDVISGGETFFRVRFSDQEERAKAIPEALPEKTPVPQRKATRELEIPLMKPPVIADLNKQPHDGLEPPTAVPPHRQSRPVVDSCPLCGKPKGDAQESISAALLAKFEHLCRTCLSRMEKQPQPIAGYQLVKELGRGGMGVVSLAISEQTGEPVALKTIIPAVSGSESDVERFIREASILKDLHHPNIVGYQELGESNGTIFLAMEYVRGMNAEEYLEKKGGPLSLKAAVLLTCQLLDALHFAHERGFVHRDIKPANLMLTKDQNSVSLKLADFGLARVYNESRLSGLTMTGELRCSVPFVAPEQILNYRDAKPPADIYSAAATFYFLLTEEFIFDFPKAPEKQLLKILQEEPIPIRQHRPEIPEAIHQLLKIGLHKEAEHRFASAQEFREKLQPFFT